MKKSGTQMIGFCERWALSLNKNVNKNVGNDVIYFDFTNRYLVK